MNVETLAKYKSFVVPAGKYYLCDPCYVISNADDWVGFLESCATEDSAGFSGHYEALSDGTKVLAFATKHGDGNYHDQHGNSFSVDSGLLGLIPCSYSPGYEGIERTGAQAEFTEDTLCFTRDGILTFGNHVIDTEE